MPSSQGQDSKMEIWRVSMLLPQPGLEGLQMKRSTQKDLKLKNAFPRLQNTEYPSIYDWETELGILPSLVLLECGRAGRPLANTTWLPMCIPASKLSCEVTQGGHEFLRGNIPNISGKVTSLCDGATILLSQENFRMKKNCELKESQTCWRWLSKQWKQLGKYPWVSKSLGKGILHHLLFKKQDKNSIFIHVEKLCQEYTTVLPF